MKKLLFLFCLLPFLQSCKEKKTVYIAANLVDCQGVGTQKCMLVKENKNDKWEYFYDSINGFTYESGYEYMLEVEIASVNNPPADGSSLAYTLKKIISKTKKSLPITIEYSAISRGFNTNIKINNTTCTIKKNGVKGNANISKEVHNWDAITQLVEAINLDEIKNLKAPSDDRLFDGAAIATINITVGDKTYKSNSFDDGTPPEAIKSLVNHVLAYLKD